MQTLQRHWRGLLLEGMDMPGVCIDLGCGRELYAHGYERLIRVDRDEKMQPDVIADLEKPLQFADGCADTVMLLDVLEHIYRYRELLAEVSRILKDGGKLILSVPMLAAEHRTAQIGDYHRFTAESLVGLMWDNGLAIENLVILKPGPLTAAVNLIAQELHWEWLFHLLLAVVKPFDWAWKRWRKWGSSWMVYAIEYMVVARKEARRVI